VKKKNEEDHIMIKKIISEINLEEIELLNKINYSISNDNDNDHQCHHIHQGDE
jgi:hypothetical protein